ncbi:hypothetical protein CVT26_010085 [Gymnopilus dilepis]|uniref:Uncharacterized protein n=1 Tax=Gymnopilus dilepis TaxID=231916 RepID=A0A409WTG2_9AGAR|nr:hypothetical protein CVT26_010085 [Gymnopilus dilepis]
MQPIPPPLLCKSLLRNLPTLLHRRISLPPPLLTRPRHLILQLPRRIPPPCLTILLNPRLPVLLPRPRVPLPRPQPLCFMTTWQQSSLTWTKFCNGTLLGNEQSTALQLFFLWRSLVIGYRFLDRLTCLCSQIMLLCLNRLTPMPLTCMLMPSSHSLLHFMYVLCTDFSRFCIWMAII